MAAPEPLSQSYQGNCFNAMVSLSEVTWVLFSRTKQEALYMSYAQRSHWIATTPHNKVPSKRRTYFKAYSLENMDNLNSL